MGVEIDLQANTASIPQGKVDKVMACLDVVAKSPGKRQKVGFWEELLGILNWPIPLIWDRGHGHSRILVI